MLGGCLGVVFTESKQAGVGAQVCVCVAVSSRIATIVKLLTARGMGRMLAG